VARSSAPRGFSSEPSSIATAAGFFPLSGLCGLHSSPGAAAVLCLPPWWGSSDGGSAVLFGSRGGGREVDLRLGEDQPFLAQEERSSSLPPGGEVVEQV